MTFSRKTLVEAIILMVVAAGAWLALNNQQDIRDWWVLRSYQPPAEIAAIAERSDFSDDGQRLFFVSQPELNDREDFNSNCQFPEKTLVLGCYSQQRIYIFSIEDDRLDGIQEVTAAHEMLHAAYDRLGSGERKQVDDWLQVAYEELDNDRIKDTLANYEQDGHGTFSNELHSILGTEAATLPAELETYFSRYFNDRDAVVALAAGYEQVFASIQSEIASLDARIADLKQQIDDTEVTLTREQSEVDQESKRLEQLRQSGQIEAYNKAVPAFNDAVTTYNRRIETYKSLVTSHNKLVENRNKLALEQNDLVHSLDSKFETIE